MSFSSSYLAYVLASVFVSVNGDKSVTIEAFGDHPTHRWVGLNDPVMGGESTGTATVIDGVGVFEGEVVNVPKLSAPGFISMNTRGGLFPNLSSCEGLSFDVMSQNDYKGFRASFGTNHPTGAMPYAIGYKARFDAPVGVFGEVEIPFTDFSDNWDPYTGDQIVTCTEDNQYCPDDTTLKNLLRFEIMAEGVLGKIRLEIKSIKAYGCDDDVVETNMQSNNSNFNSHPSYVPPVVLSNGDIRIESFDDPQHKWVSLNDPVMGGMSTSTVIIQDDAAVFDGTVVDVPGLESPGFIMMQTRGGAFADVSGCKALKINLMSSVPYEGLHATFGTHHAEGTPPYVRGYKAPFTAPVGAPEDVVIPFTDFSDSWDPKTGDIIVACADDSSHCPDQRTLKDFTILAIMGEGVNGDVHVEVNSIVATDCATDSTQSTLTSTENMTEGPSDSSTTNALVWVAFAFGGVGVALGAFFYGKQRGMSQAISQQMVQMEPGKTPDVV